jgi:hypothetical protein
MKINRRSLSSTLDSVNEALFFNHKTSQAEREETARWIASRQGKPNSYANMFAPTADDIKNGIRLFTGETVRSGAALRHVSGEEACRALILLKPRSKEVRSAMAKASDGILSRLEVARQKNRELFCCGTCDPALWRHINAGGLPGSERWIDSGLKFLKAHRKGDGTWLRFPFYYTLLALSETDLSVSLREMKYAAKAAERRLSRMKPTSPTNIRRITVLERALEMC